MSLRVEQNDPAYVTSPSIGTPEDSGLDTPSLPWKRILVGLVVGTVFLLLLYRQIDLSAWREALREADYVYLPFAFLLLLVRWGLAGLRWRTLLWPVSNEPFMRSVAVVSATATGNLAIPGRAGEAWRAHFVGRGSGTSRSTVLGVIVVERVLDGLVALAIALIFVIAVAAEPTPLALVLVPTLCLAAAALVLTTLSRSGETRSRLLSGLAGLLPQRFQEFAADKAELFMAGVRDAGGGPTLLRALGLTAAIVAIEGMALYLLGEAFSFGLGFWEYVPVMAIANLSTAIPVSIGGIGPFEYFVTAALRLLDVDASAAAAFAVALHALVNLAIIATAAGTAWALRRPLGAADAHR
ncbi:MAG TPA: lysylphosphatidylglycerol synthase transmembrane domain-containing protein [Dehalococcoidia bacterium]|nr:lysylphosphatidylglycerol synthase transmembrane domain-containing protein [Dehalococcoidia bacterium]